MILGYQHKEVRGPVDKDKSKMMNIWQQKIFKRYQINIAVPWTIISANNFSNGQET
jgi:hypothetical protein